jgi:hypothetical protein
MARPSEGGRQDCAQQLAMKSASSSDLEEMLQEELQHIQLLERLIRRMQSFSKEHASRMLSGLRSGASIEELLHV